jgi:hypothetical protein
MNQRPQDTSAEEPEGGNPHIRFRGWPRPGDQPGLLNRVRHCGGIFAASAATSITMPGRS